MPGKGTVKSVSGKTLRGLRDEKEHDSIFTNQPEPTRLPTHHRVANRRHAPRSSRRSRSPFALLSPSQSRKQLSVRLPAIGARRRGDQRSSLSSFCSWCWNSARRVKCEEAALPMTWPVRRSVHRQSHTSNATFDAPHSQTHYHLVREQANTRLSPLFKHMFL